MVIKRERESMVYYSIVSKITFDWLFQYKPRYYFRLAFWPWGPTAMFPLSSNTGDSRTNWVWTINNTDNSRSHRKTHPSLKQIGLSCIRGYVHYVGQTINKSHAASTKLEPVWVYHYAISISLKKSTLSRFKDRKTLYSLINNNKYFYYFH